MPVLILGRQVNETIVGDAMRIILIVPDPDERFARALKAGAAEIFPVVGDMGGGLAGRESFGVSLGNGIFYRK